MRVLNLLIIILFLIESKSFAQNATIDSMLKRLPQQSDSLKVTTLNRIAFEYTRLDSNQVIKYTNQSIQLAKKINFLGGIIDAYGVLKSTAYYYSDMDRADYWCDKQLELCKKDKRFENIKLSCLNSKAMYAFRRGDMAKTTEYAKIAITEGEKALFDVKNADKHYELIVYMGLNIAANALFSDAISIKDHPNQNELEQSFLYFKRCLTLCEKYPTLTHNIPTVNHNIGCYYVEKKDKKTALAYFKEEEKGAIQLDREVDLIGCYYSQAEILFENKQYQEAEKLLLKAQELEKKYKDPDHLVIIPHMLGKIYLKTGRYAQADEILKNALNLVEEKQFPEQKSTILEDLYQLKKQQGDYQNALLYLESHTVLNDSLYSQAKTKNINEITTKYETEKKEQSIANLESEKTLRNYIIVSIILLVLVAIFAAYNKYQAMILEKNVMVQAAYAKEQEAQKNKIEAESQQRELTLQGLYLEQRKNILKEIKKKLLDLSKDDVFDKKVLVREIDATLQFENEWQNFRIHFENTNPAFFQKLLAFKNTLTDLDLRHCAYIKMGLSPKQVAQILNIEAESVSIARVRLKKKLEITADDSLHDFIRNIN